MYPFLILLLSMAPWKPSYQTGLFNVRLFVHEYPCDALAWTGPDRNIHLCPGPDHDWRRFGLHETQHIMASTYLGYTDFDIFARVAMQDLYNGDYTLKQIEEAQYYLGYGAYQLHAELPGILYGDIPSSLQSWYPWFDLGQHHGLVPLRNIPRGR